MENEITFDFDYISDYDEFYSALKRKFDLPDWFGNNLDAFYDFISGELKLPCHLKLINLNPEQIEDFEDLFEMLEDAENEISGFSFSYYMEQFDNFEEDEYSD